MLSVGSVQSVWGTIFKTVQIHHFAFVFAFFVHFLFSGAVKPTQLTEEKEERKIKVLRTRHGFCQNQSCIRVYLYARPRYSISLLCSLMPCRLQWNASHALNAANDDRFIPSSVHDRDKATQNEQRDEYSSQRLLSFRPKPPRGKLGHSGIRTARRQPSPPRKEPLARPRNRPFRRSPSKLQPYADSERERKIAY